MSSRIELKSYINSTHLFENLIEPESLNSGFKIVIEQEIDTCIFGPSLRSDNIREFLNDLKAIDHNSNCAFLSTYREGEKEEIDGIHHQALFPCTRQTLYMAIIQALQNANGGMFPPPKRTNPITGEPLFLKDAIEKLDLESGSAFNTVAPKNRPLTETNQTSSKASVNTFSEQASELAKVLAEIEPHNLKFRPNDTPSGVTTETIQTLINKLFPNTEREHGVANFKLNLEQLLYKWIQNATQNGRKTANAHLREGILRYFSEKDK